MPTFKSLTTAYLIRIKYPLSGSNYHISDVNAANFNKVHRTRNSCLKMELENRCLQYGNYRLAYLLHVSAERFLRTRSTFSKSVIVSVAVSILGITERCSSSLLQNFDGAYYSNVLLGQHLLPAMTGDLFCSRKLLHFPTGQCSSSIHQISSHLNHHLNHLNLNSSPKSRAL